MWHLREKVPQPLATQVPDPGPSCPRPPGGTLLCWLLASAPQLGIKEETAPKP